MALTSPTPPRSGPDARRQGRREPLQGAPAPDPNTVGAGGAPDVENGLAALWWHFFPPSFSWDRPSPARLSAVDNLSCTAVYGDLLFFSV